MTIQRRLYEADIEIRGGDGRTLWGIFAPFDAPTPIRDYEGVYTETIQQGAFARSINNRGDRIPAFANHSHHDLPIGAVRGLHEAAAGLAGEMYVSKTAQGDEILELVKDGAMRSFSIGFQAVKDKDIWSPDRDSVIRTEVNLQEVSVVTYPAYPEAAIAGVRYGNLVVDAPLDGTTSGTLEISTPVTPPLDPNGLAPDEPSGMTAVQARARAFLIQRNLKWTRPNS